MTKDDFIVSRSGWIQNTAHTHSQRRWSGQVEHILGIRQQTLADFDSQFLRNLRTHRHLPNVRVARQRPTLVGEMISIVRLYQRSNVPARDSVPRVAGIVPVSTGRSASANCRERLVVYRHGSRVRAESMQNRCPWHLRAVASNGSIQSLSTEAFDGPARSNWQHHGERSGGDQQGSAPAMVADVTKREIEGRNHAGALTSSR